MDQKHWVNKAPVTHLQRQISGSHIGVSSITVLWKWLLNKSRPNCDKLDKLKFSLNIIKHENSMFVANFVWQADKKIFYCFHWCSCCHLLSWQLEPTQCLAHTRARYLCWSKPGLSLNGLFFFLLVAGCESCSVAKCLPNAIRTLNAQSP